jgi:hypothetical protein
MKTVERDVVDEGKISETRKELYKFAVRLTMPWVSGCISPLDPKGQGKGSRPREGWEE